ncbi:MAG TPA: MmgE/PrpD family protein [Solirubrobacterales bacterium]|jgi:2-methylcitrate dehydratase PrpD
MTQEAERPTTPKLAERLATFAAETSFDELPAEVVEATKLQLLDTVGVGLGAHAGGADVGGAAAAALRTAEEAGQGPASVIGRERGLPAADAAFANGVLFHTLDFDDTHAGSITHVSAVNCAAALAAAEAAGAGGREMLAASAVGKEVTIRLGLDGIAVALLERGFHPTAVLGVFGATAGAARLRGLDPAAIASGLGIAGSLAAGLFAYLADGTDTKPLHAGFAARNGVHAAALAAAGAAGPPSIFEGRFGIYDAYLGRREAELDLDDLGRRWELPLIAVKAYPACHFVHSSVHGAGELAQDGGVDPASIRRIVVFSPGPGVEVVLEPAAAKVAPRTAYEAKFSMQYSVAAMLVHGRVDLDSYSAPAIADPAVLDLARLVEYEVRDYPSYPASYPGGIEIELQNGEVLNRDLPHQPGSAENPLSADAVREKFRRNAALALGAEEAELIERQIMRLEQLDDLAELTAALRRA